jgi:hypothetical protein
VESVVPDRILLPLPPFASAIDTTLQLWVTSFMAIAALLALVYALQLMRRGLSRTQLWGLFVAGIVGDIILEVSLLHFDTYIYHGWQPLVFLKFPLGWGPVNSLITMLAGAIVCRYEAYLTDGWRQLQIIPITLTVSAAGNTIAGWPSWLAINTDLGPALTQLGGIATFILSAWFMSMIIAVVAQASAANERANVEFAPHTAVANRH